MAEFDVNINEIVGHAAADLIESFFTSLGDKTAEQIKRFKIKFGKGFSRYLAESFNRYSNHGRS
ncbi:hypothetical protein [Rhizobium sp. BK376]|uniref:hypothetical protein n=1 Tax=Rhizobium sp. BK376 TaxID=2512149 RepID=UPI0010446825|nr:hypothetical protein [Rhizobium sp. BK376]TCR70722.1 hypothetical protein EV561_13834 [Rhizobium sp. BK376]